MLALTLIAALQLLLLIFDGLDLGLVDVGERSPLAPVYIQPVEHGCDLWVESRKLLQTIRYTQGGCVRKAASSSNTNKYTNRFVSKPNLLKLCVWYLVHEGADKIDETTLHLGKLGSVISVHHGLTEEEEMIIIAIIITTT